MFIKDRTEENVFLLLTKWTGTWKLKTKTKNLLSSLGSKHFNTFPEKRWLPLPRKQMCVYQGINWMKCQKQTHINSLDNKFETKNLSAALALRWWTHITLCTAVKFMVFLGCCPDWLGLPFHICPGIPPHLQGVIVSFRAMPRAGASWVSLGRPDQRHTESLWSPHFLIPCLL